MAFMFALQVVLLVVMICVLLMIRNITDVFLKHIRMLNGVSERLQLSNHRLDAVLSTRELLDLQEIAQSQNRLASSLEAALGIKPAALDHMDPEDDGDEL